MTISGLESVEVAGKETEFSSAGRNELVVCFAECGDFEALVADPT